MLAVCQVRNNCVVYFDGRCRNIQNDIYIAHANDYSPTYFSSGTEFQWLLIISGRTINRKLERSLGLERLSSSRAGFLIDELGQEPQSYWQTSTRRIVPGVLSLRVGLPFGTYIDIPDDHMIPSVMSLSPLLVWSCTVPPCTTHYRAVNPPPPPPPRVIALCLAMVKLENN